MSDGPPLPPRSPPMSPGPGPPPRIAPMSGEPERDMPPSWFVKVGASFGASGAIVAPDAPGRVPDTGFGGASVALPIGAVIAGVGAFGAGAGVSGASGALGAMVGPAGFDWANTLAADVAASATRTTWVKCERWGMRGSLDEGQRGKNEPPGWAGGWENDLVDLDAWRRSGPIRGT